MVAKPGGQLTVSGDQLLCRRHIRACSSTWTWTWICAPVLEQALTGCTSTWTCINWAIIFWKLLKTRKEQIILAFAKQLWETNGYCCWTLNLIIRIIKDFQSKNLFKVSGTRCTMSCQSANCELKKNKLSLKVLQHHWAGQPQRAGCQWG